MQHMIRLARRKGWSWLGIVLVLAQLLAPTVSHALRTADAAALPLSLDDLCSSLHGGAGPAMPDPGSRDVTLPDPACGYCLQGGATAPPPCLPTSALSPPMPAGPTLGAAQSWSGRPPLRHDAARSPPVVDFGPPAFSAWR